MNYRLNNALIIAVSILVVLAIGLFVYTLISSTSEEVEEQPSAQEQQVQEERIINAKHFVGGEDHTVAGLVTVPSPCHSVSVEPFVTSDGVELRFTTILESEEACPDLPSDTSFRVVFTAPVESAITAVWNGVPATLNLIPAESRESLDEEFYFKG